MPREPKDPNQPKRKKSTYGSGTIYSRKDGRYVASIKNPVSGDRIERYAKTKKEAEKKLEDIKFELRQGTLTTGPDQTMSRYLEYWLESIHRPQIRIGTYERYKGLIRNHIIPAIGKIQMRKLSPYHVQNLYSSPAVAKLSPGSITKIHAVLHTALDKAVEWNLIARNVCDVVSPPSQKKREYTVLNMAQAKRLLESAKGHRLEALLTLTVASGMRRGEIFGLKWEDVDLNNGAVQIKRTMSRVGKHGIITSEPKTSRGRRKILLPQFAVDALKLHYEYQLEAKEKAGSKWEENGFVFPNTLGKYLGESALHSIFKKLLAETGLPYMRFHDLRHSAATILLSMGVHPKVVQELLGHSQISTTLDTYSHVLPTVQKEAMDKFNDLFNQ